jgi:hypothetical protein
MVSYALGGQHAFSLLPLHHRNFIRRQIIELVDQLVNLPVCGGNLALELLLLGLCFG